MIFVTLGSNPTFRFDRLIEAIAPLSPDELVVQHGPATPPPQGAKEVHEWLTFEQVLEYMDAADVVISHVGAGTILCAAQMGHVPVVMPRLKRYGEAVDDHQVALASMFERTGRVAVVWEPQSLPERVAQASRRHADGNEGDGKLVQTVRAALLGVS